MKKWISAPYLVWMAVFIVVPLLMVAYFAFTNEQGAFTLEYIKNVAGYSDILVRSIAMAAFATIICLLVAYPLAMILSRMDVKAQSMMIMIVMVPMWMNFLLRTYAWQTILGNNGILNTILC